MTTLVPPCSITLEWRVRTVEPTYSRTTKPTNRRRLHVYIKFMFILENISYPTIIYLNKNELKITKTFTQSETLKSEILTTLSKYILRAIVSKYSVNIPSFH